MFIYIYMYVYNIQTHIWKDKIKTWNIIVIFTVGTKHKVGRNILGPEQNIKVLNPDLKE